MERTTPWRVAATLTLAVLGSADCARGPRVPDSAYADAREIEAGCSGGFAGLVKAVRVSRDGELVALDRRSPSARPIGSVPRARAAEWFATLERERFFEIDTSAFDKRWRIPDAMACGLSLIGPQHSHSVRVERPSGAPETVRDLHAELLGFYRER